MSNTALVLRTCAADGASYNGFKWPLTVGARVEAPNWDNKPECGNGLHGAMHGEGNGGLFNWDADAVWMVVEVDSDWIVDLIGKVKFPSCVIRFVGDRKGATDYIMANDPLARCVIGGTATAGYRGTATAGDLGTATAGDSGTATAGDSGTATAGYRGTATAGDSGTATAGYSGTATAGDRGTATAGYRGTATAGDSGTATAGYRGTATAGDRGTATAGCLGTATAGDSGILQIKWYDGNRYRITTGYVGEDGIEANVAYRCDDAGKFVRAK